MIKSLSDLESRFSLPEFDRTVVESLNRGDFSGSYRLGLYRLDSDLGPNIVPNFLPLVKSETGDELGFYFPKGNRDKPFPVIQYSQYLGEDSDRQLFPKECGLGEVFTNSELMRSAVEDAEVDENWAYLKTCPEWAELVIKPNNGVVRLNDLLKPMALNWRFLLKLDEQTTGVLPSGDVLFRGRRDFREIDCWLDLADFLESDGDNLGALKALENCISVLWRYPDYGGGNLDEVPRECEEIWKRIASFENLDGFDRALAAAMIRSFEKRRAG